MKKKALLLMLVLMFVSTNALAQNDIYGYVTGDVQAGVTVTLKVYSCGLVDMVSTTTNEDGYYAFGGLQNRSYAIVPENDNYTFDPTYKVIQIPQLVIQPHNFTATLITYGISGTVSGDEQSGVTMTLSGDSDATTTTAENGTYSFAELVPGSYTITPSLTDYTFDPESTNVTIIDTDETGVDFTATITYGISGTISGDEQSGVTMTLSGDRIATTITAPNGTYSFAELPPGSYTITPSLDDYTFEPEFTSITIIDDDIVFDDIVCTFYVHGEGDCIVTYIPTHIGGGEVEIFRGTTCSGIRLGLGSVIYEGDSFSYEMLGCWAVGPMDDQICSDHLWSWNN